MHDLLIIPLAFIAVIGDADIGNLIAHFHPDIAGRRDRADFAKNPVGDASNQESSKEIEVVNALGANGHFAANGTGKAHDVDEDTGNVGGVAAPMETQGVVVWTGFLARVEISDLQVALAHDVIVTDHDAGNGRKEDRVRGEISGEVVGVGEEVPRAHDETDKGTDVTTTPDADPAWC